MDLSTVQVPQVRKSKINRLHYRNNFMLSIPDQLKRNHEDGNVIFFCGAGVSMPAGLPSFNGLVELALSDLIPQKESCEANSVEFLAWQALEDKKYDEALGILESHQHGGYEAKHVREKVCYHLSNPKIKTLASHFALARLAKLDTERGRLVTTNFDPLFESAQEKLTKQEGANHQMHVHVAPSLPPAKPETFQGLAYLHGKLNSSPNNQQLVLTAANFGTAYMLEGWALRFVIGLFRHYHVVFIGYSVGDPIMRYLIQALAAARSEHFQHFKDPYAFAPYSIKNEKDAVRVEQQWKLSGITPILYIKNENHQQLWEAIKKWGDEHRQGITGRRLLVSRLSQSPPVSDENDPAIRDMAWALRDVDVARYFAAKKGKRKPDPRWITSLDAQGLFCLPIGQTDSDQPISVPLVTSWRLADHFDLNEVTFHLGGWIAKCLESREVLDWVLSKGAILHRQFRLQIQYQLDQNKSKLPPALRKIWQLLSDGNYAYMLSEMRHYPYSFHSTHARLAPGATFAVQNFLNRLRPIPIFKKENFRRRQIPDPNCLRDWCEIKIELFGIEYECDIQRLRKNASDWDGAVAAIADDLTSRLREAMDWFHEFELARWHEDITHFEYRSISPHEQNKHAPVWTQLIALARESYDILVANGNLVAASNLVQRWLSLPYPVFQRLAMYAVTETPALNIEIGLEILLDKIKPALWDVKFRREMFRLLRKRGQDIPKPQLNRLTEVILEGPPRAMYREDLEEVRLNALRDHHVLLRLHKLKESGASLPLKANDAYDRIQQDRPWQPPGDRSEEFSSFFSSYTTTPEPVDISEIEKLEEMSTEKFITLLQTRAGEGPPFWGHGGVWFQFVTNNTQTAVKLLKGAADRNVWISQSWYPVLSVCGQNESVSEDLKQEVAELFVHIPLTKLRKLNYEAASWFESSIRQLSFTLRQKLWQKIWKASYCDEEPQYDLNFNMSLNHAGGILGKVLYNELLRHIPEVAPGQHLGFPKHLREGFEHIEVCENSSSKLARVRIAPVLYFLYRIDPNWTERTFLYRMDPEDEKKFDQFLWEGFLWFAQCPTDLLVAIKHLLFKVLRNLDCIPKDSRSRAVELFAYWAVPPSNEINSNEAKGVLLALEPDELKSVARVLNDMLQCANEKSPVLWKESIGPWFNSVWPKRLIDRSPHLSEGLAQMAIESGEAFPFVVNAIKDILIPEEWSTAICLLQKEEMNSRLVSRHPKESLMLIDKIIHEKSNVTKIGQLWDMLSKADPSLKKPDSIKRHIWS